MVIHTRQPALPVDDRIVALNNLPVGYGFLQESANYTEVASWIDWRAGRTTDGTVITGIRSEAEIIVTEPDHSLNFLEVVANYQPGDVFSFAGWKRTYQGHMLQLLNIPVQIEGYLCEIYWGGRRAGEFTIREIQSQSNPTQPQSRSLCDLCIYYLPGNPSVCNAFHPTTGMTECSDFTSR